MDKLLLVDGSNLLFQMFFGMPARIVGKNSKPIQGVLGFVGALLKIIKMTEPITVNCRRRRTPFPSCLPFMPLWIISGSNARKPIPAKRTT